MCDPIVEVEQGKLKGSVRKTKDDVQYYSFKSIPYAKPPVGNLRFSIPQPPEPWEGVKNAIISCNICAQFDRVTNTVVGDEDCLYLNVYTPKLPTSDCATLPVMVFFHGGGFVFGNGTDDAVHGPDFLIEKDVIIVSLNYRVGILGFLSLNCKDAPGNMGLRDQVQALKWVQKNIAKFGGDRNNVTIFGISAGGASVEYLVLSRMAKGLFHKAIAQSGSSLNHWAQNSNVKELAALIPVLQGKILSGTEPLLQYLKELPLKNLIMFSMAALAANAHKGGIHFGFVPSVETPSDWEPFLDKSPYDLLANGEFTKVPYLSGFCEREGLLMLGFGSVIMEKLVKGKEFTPFLPFEIDETQKPELEKKLKVAYLETETKFKEPDAFAVDFFGDVDFIAGVHVAANLIAKNNSPVYFYEFAYDGGFNYMKKKINIDRKGTCHGDDGGYIVKSGLLSDEFSGTDKLVRDRVREMWSNFAKYGDPTPKTDDLITTKWAPLAETGCGFLRIDDKLTMKEDVYPNRMKLYKELYENYKLTK
ncbi:juvenile hormone esterase-like [Pectinophora gossypiella]|uniref:juvenile hormone esterase-like n=1 Tax=Pectinophora gossypiella TaxID=13191 RepID=UPI00214EFC99|nr:juvenile hormone esterase-like [Pectinophora gossypiella]